MAFNESIASIVLVGQIGSGKTTLYNKITGANEETQSGGISVTRSVFSKQAAYSDKFRVSDTPGMGSWEQKLHHYGGILAALSEGNVKRIMFVERFARVESIAQNMMERTKAFVRYKKMITVVVTHFDESQNKQNDKKLIQQYLQKCNLNSVLFVGKDDDGRKISSEIDVILKNSQEQKIELEPQEYLRYFDLVELDPDSSDFQATLESSATEVLINFRWIQKACSQYIQNLKKGDADVTGVVQAAMDFVKNTADSLIDQFLKNNDDVHKQLQKLNNEHLIYLAHFQLKKELLLDIDKIFNEGYKKLSECGFKYHEYIRKCNYCQEIWFKVEGCSGDTYCGRVPSGDKDKDNKQNIKLVQYKVYYLKDKKQLIVEENQVQQSEQEIKNNEENKNIQLKRLEQKKLEKQKLQQRQEKKLGNENCIIGEYGCGKKIDWGSMKAITEEEAKIFIDPGYLREFEEIQQRVEKERTLKNKVIEQNFLSAINQQIQSIKKN